MNAAVAVATVVGVTGELEPRELRVSDAEREHVGELLQRAMAQGRITLDEFSERMDTAMNARTRGELNSVLVDLPGMRVHGAAPDGDNTAAVELRTTGSTLTRRGQWTVPAAMRLSGRLGSRKLDLSQALIEHAVIDIEFDDHAVSTVLIVGEGTTADADRLEATFGSVQNSVGSGPPRGRPHLELHGRVRLGSVAVRYSRRGKLRRMVGRW